jgi:hypothetical protein
MLARLLTYFYTPSNRKPKNRDRDDEKTRRKKEKFLISVVTRRRNFGSLCLLFHFLLFYVLVFLFFLMTPWIRHDHHHHIIIQVLLVQYVHNTVQYSDWCSCFMSFFICHRVPVLCFLYDLYFISIWRGSHGSLQAKFLSHAVMSYFCHVLCHVRPSRAVYFYSCRSQKMMSLVSGGFIYPTISLVVHYHLLP